MAEKKKIDVSNLEKTFGKRNVAQSQKTLEGFSESKMEKITELTNSSTALLRDIVSNELTLTGKKAEKFFNQQKDLLKLITGSYTKKDHLAWAETFIESPNKEQFAKSAGGKKAGQTALEITKFYLDPKNSK